MRMPGHVIEAIDNAVEKGATRLDARRKNWYREINLRTLDLGDGCMCITGQLYGSYCQESIARIIGGWVRSLLPRGSYGSSWSGTASRYGFDLPTIADEWADEPHDDSDDFVFYGAAANRANARGRAVWNRLERKWKEQIKARLAAEETA